jgi:hypothetical protein
MRRFPSLGVTLAACLCACGGSEDEPDTTAPAAEPGSAGAEEPVADAAQEEESAPPAGPIDDSAAPTGAQDTPAEYACRLERDYNACVIERLEGRVSTESDLILLIQAYRMKGRNDDARAHMQRLIDEYPDSPQAQTYRDYLGGF